jgi:hypothetical protein
MHLHPCSVLDDLAWHCPCGARAHRRYGQCRKCQSRAAWWRRTGGLGTPSEPAAYDDTTSRR